MGRSEPPGPAPRLPVYPPADLGRRGMARLCDVLVGFFPVALFQAGDHPVVGSLCGAALLLCSDRLFGPGRSLGKRLFGLRCVVLATQQPSGITASMRRNAAFATAMVLAALGDGRGPSLALLGTALVGTAETVVLLSPWRRLRDLGRRRLGDLAAGTQVIDASVGLQLGQLAVLGPGEAGPVLPAPAPQRAARLRLFTLARLSKLSKLTAYTKLPARPGPGVPLLPPGRPEGPACASP